MAFPNSLKKWESTEEIETSETRIVSRMKIPELHTNRLILEPVQSRHAAEMISVLSSPSLYQFFEGKPPNLEGLEALYNKWEQRQSPDGRELWLNWIARDRKSRKAIGYFQSGIPHEGDCYVAYVLGAEFHRKGYASEGLASLISYLRIEQEKNEIKAWVDTRNNPSINLLRRNGFQQVGSIDDAGFFNGQTSDEFVFSLTLKSKSPDDYDISYDFDEITLRENLNNPGEAAAYSDLLRRRVHRENQLPTDSREHKNIVQSLGMAGSLLKMLSRLEEARRCLGQAINLIKYADLPPSIFLAQSIRYHDVLRLEGKWDEAESGFKDCIEKSEDDSKTSTYKDVALQHLGKLYFDRNRFAEAENCFQRALELRLKKNDSQLIESSKLALGVTQKRLRQTQTM